MITEQREKEVLGKAYDYIVAVREKQGRFLFTAKELYGDGSRFLPLTLKGFEAVYNEIKGMLGE